MTSGVVCPVIARSAATWQSEQQPKSNLSCGGHYTPSTIGILSSNNVVHRTGQRLVSTQTVQHDYLTLGGRVARETITTDGTVTAVLDFIYDSQGRPFALNYSTNGGSSFTTYYYVLNLQGDVVKLISYIPGFEYEEVASYTYDAWGNIISATGEKAELNPLRYRGYYYDSETGFYYLQSRYYDPATHRFINADVYASTDSTDAISCNMFAYCGNNPVSRSDETGDFWNIIVGAIVGAVVNTVSAIIEGKSVDEVIVSAVCGAVSGGMAASGVGGIGGQMLTGAITSFVDSGWSNAKKAYNGEMSWGNAITTTLVSTGMGVVTAAMGYEGPVPSAKTDTMIKAGWQGIKTVVSRGVTTSARNSAKQAAKRLGKYIAVETFSGSCSSLLSFGVSEFSKMYYAAWEK